MPKSFHKMKLDMFLLIETFFIHSFRGGTYILLIAEKDFHQAIESSTAVKSQRGADSQLMMNISLDVFLT